MHSTVSASQCRREVVEVHRKLTLDDLDKPPQEPATASAVQIQPKALLANERTFLAWLHSTSSIGVLALGALVSIPRDDVRRVVPLALLVIVIGFSWAALWVMWQRTKALGLVKYADPASSRTRLLSVAY